VLYSVTVAAVALTLEELTKFGIRPADEGAHRWSPDHHWWNESWFLDWFDGAGGRAGHVRIGLHPNQDRAWLWFVAFEHGEWAVLEETRLPLADLDIGGLAYDRWGLSFSWERSDPLRHGRVRVSGYGRVATGPRSGLVLPVSADLEYDTVGSAHSTGPSDVPGHSAVGYSACRFEQAVGVHGRFGIGEPTRFEGRGERDHSWGPRDWNMEWTFCVVGGDDFRMQWAVVDLPDLGRFATGYLHTDTTVTITDVEHELEFADGDLARAVAGPFTVTADDGTVLSGRIDPVTSIEIDLAHTFDPPRPTGYRRTLVRYTPEGGGPTPLGWLESNRFSR
jgi:hypothetical protein